VTDLRLELAEAAAMESVWTGAGLPVRRIAGAVCMAFPDVPENTMLNRADALGLAGPVGADELDDVDAFFRLHRVHYAVGVSPLAAPGLRELLRSRGFTDGYAWMKFRREPVEPNPAETALQIEEPRSGADFGVVISAAYGLAPEIGAATFEGLPGREGWSCFVAYEEDVPAGAGALYAHDGVGWFGCAGTVAEHRGKGAQSAIFAARIRRARELGLDVLTTETGERVPDRPSNSYRNILRAGFVEAYLRPNLVAPT
jgi:GNAT superfamily N-acetyltransferase